MEEGCGAVGYFRGDGGDQPAVYGAAGRDRDCAPCSESASGGFVGHLVLRIHWDLLRLVCSLAKSTGCGFGGVGCAARNTGEGDFLSYSFGAGGLRSVPARSDAAGGNFRSVDGGAVEGCYRT